MKNTDLENPITGWISVDESLPDDERDYLVTDGYACMVATLKENQQWHFWGIEWWSSNEVTHWMPLPPTPNQITEKL